MKARLFVGAALACAMLSACAGCASHPSPPAVVGENFPGTCLPGELRWPTDFIESLPGESSAVGGRIVGLRLEYVDSEWVWRLRSAAQKTNMFGDNASDPSFGRDSIVDARAYAEEYAYVTYKGVGKAAANVYSGQRIITVCFWWTRGGSAVTGTTCSNASSATGAWRAGPEVVGWATDSLDSNAPKTIFNIQTTRINPNIV